jgi:glycosyltransferase involved in cell wall biosynthesis
MNIAFIGQKGFPATYGGVERHVEELALRLAARGHRPCVYSRPHYGHGATGLDRGVSVVTLPSVPTKHLDAISHVAVCTAHALLHGADVVHYHAVGPALLSWAPRSCGVGTVATIHGRDWQRPKWSGGAAAALRAGEWMAMRAPDETIVVSRSLTDELSAQYGRKAHYIPNGISLQETQDTSILDELGLEPGRFVLFASRLVPEKGAHYLTAAWRGVPAGMKLVMAGDSSFSADYVRGVRESCADDGVVFPGFVYGARLAALFRNAALFVLPSDVEGLPIVLLEALGYGTPVLASDIPPNREVLGPLGRTFKAGDVGDLRAALSTAIEDLPELQAQAAAGAAGIAEEYDWDVVTEQTEAVYAAVVARKAGPNGRRRNGGG